MIHFEVQTDDGPALVFLATGEQDAILVKVWLRAAAGQVLGLDTENNAMSPWHPDHRVRLVQISDGRSAWLLPTGGPGDHAWVWELVRSHDYWCAHFSEAEVRFLSQGSGGRAIRLDQDGAPHVADTQVLLGWYEPRTLMPRGKDGVDPRLALPRGLKETCDREFGPALSTARDALHAWFAAHAPKGQRTKERSIQWGFAHVPVGTPEYLIYGALDAIMVKRLWDRMAEHLHRSGEWPLAAEDLLDQWDIDRAMYRGQPVDAPYVRWLAGRLDDRIIANGAELAAHGIAPSGQGATVAAAFDALDFRSEVLTGGGQPSYAKAVLKDIAKRQDGVGSLARLLNDSRQATKFRSAYLRPMLDALELDGRLHPSMRAVGTITHRHSAANPPVQQLPKKDPTVRAAIGGAPGHTVVSCDFNQGEPRTMAALSHDPAYVAAVLSGDVNNATAAAAYGDAFNPAEGKVAGTASYLYRQNAKVGLLSVCYGVGLKKLADALGCMVAEARVVYDRWHAEYRVMFGRGDRLGQQTAVVLPNGRRIPLWDRFTVGEHGELLVQRRPSRKALNYETQGAQRDYLMRAWHQLRGKWAQYLLLFVHDEIVLLVPDALVAEAQADLAEAMTFALTEQVTMTCEATIDGPTWLPQPEAFTPDLSIVDDDELETTA